MSKIEPDAYCVTMENGECISTDPRCMHNKPVSKIKHDLENLKKENKDSQLVVQSASEIHGCHGGEGATLEGSNDEQDKF